MLLNLYKLKGLYEVKLILVLLALNVPFTCSQTCYGLLGLSKQEHDETSGICNERFIPSAA